MSPVAPASDPAPTPLPRWATSLDILCVILLGLTLLLLAFGGVRFHVAGLRISIMSVWRPFIGALAVAAIRHALVHRDPLHARALRWATTTGRSEAFGASWPVFLETRLAVLAIGYFATVTIGYADRGHFRVYANELHNLPARWDAGWYLAIATDGYRWSADATGQQNVAFFPAYPILMRIVGRLLRDETLWAGVLISHVAFFGALLYFHRLARQRLDATQAAVATTLLATYPFALFFSAAYTESLFLLAAVGAVYHFGRGELIASGGWGILAGLTRPNGCLLAIPLGVALLEQRRTQPRVDRRTIAHLSAAAMPLAGFAMFSAFLWRLTGNPLEWAASHAEWGRTFEGLHRIVIDRYEVIREYGLYRYTFSLPVDALNGIAAVFGLAMVWPVWKRLGPSAAAFILVNLIPPLAMGGLLSIGRVTCVLFPIFICLAMMIAPARRVHWLLGFAMLQAFFAALFFTWRPLY